MSIYTLITDNLDWTGLRLNVYVQPGASKTEVAGLRQERLKIRLAARAEDGLANTELCSFLSKIFQVPKSSISIEQGMRGRQKLVRICGSPDKLRAIADSLINEGRGS